jgi:hypothetical protein
MGNLDLLSFQLILILTIISIFLHDSFRVGEEGYCEQVKDINYLLEISEGNFSFWMCILNFINLICIPINHLNQQ